MDRLTLPQKVLECSRRFSDDESCIKVLEAETRDILNRLYLANINDDEVTKYECIEIELDYINQILIKINKRFDEIRSIIDEHKHYWESDE